MGRRIRTVLLGAALAAGLAALSPLAAEAQSSCRVRLADLPRIEPQDDYDPFAAAPPPEYDRIEIEHRGGPGCAFALGVDNGQNGGRRAERDGDLLSYQLYRDASLTTPVADASGSPSGMFTGFLNDDDEVAFEFYSVFPAGQLGAPGLYKDTLVFTLYELTDGVVGRVLDSRNIQVRARMEEVVQASVSVGGGSTPLAGANRTLDLGQLRSGQRVAFAIEVTGNTEYDLRLESENDGSLIGQGNATPIGYSLSVDGRAVSLSREVVLAFDGEGTQNHQFDITVGEIGNALAGTYTDNLYLTVSAR